MQEAKTRTNLSMLKLLAPFIGPYYKQAILILLLLPLGSLAYSIQPTIMQRAIDGPISAYASYASLSVFLIALTPYLGILLLAIVVNFFIQINMLYTINYLGQHLVADIRAKLFDHLEHLPMKFFDKTPVGRNVTRITNDMEQLADSFAGGLILTVVDIVNALGIIAFMCYLNLRLSFAVIFLLIPMYFIARYFQEQFRVANIKARAELSHLNSFLQQCVVGIDVVQALDASKQSMRKFGEINKRYFRANDDSIKADSAFSAAIELVAIVTIALLIYLSKEILFSGSLISIGVIIAFLQYAQTLFDPIRNLSDRFSIIQAGFTAAERISELLEEPISIVDVDSDQAVMLEDLAREFGAEFPTIEFRHVYFSYGTSPVLEDFNLVIKPAESLALVGKTGSGKSSIVKLLTRLYEAQQGEILINGVNIKRIALEDLRNFISVVHQDSYIFSGDLNSNIGLGRSNVEMVMADTCLEVLSKSGIALGTVLEQRATNISAGEEQVINFARALVTKPRILILDEASANIDVATETKLLESLRNYRSHYPVTLIAIAHRLETVADFDRVVDISAV
jgi:ATP-binding cassette subfamily B protein